MMILSELLFRKQTLLPCIFGIPTLCCPCSIAFDNRPSTSSRIRSYHFPRSGYSKLTFHRSILWSRDIMPYLDCVAITSPYNWTATAASETIRTMLQMARVVKGLPKKPQEGNQVGQLQQIHEIHPFFQGSLPSPPVEQGGQHAENGQEGAGGLAEMVEELVAMHGSSDAMSSAIPERVMDTTERQTEQDEGDADHEAGGSEDLRHTRISGKRLLGARPEYVYAQKKPRSSGKDQPRQTGIRRGTKRQNRVRDLKKCLEDPRTVSSPLQLLEDVLFSLSSPLTSLLLCSQSKPCAK